MSIFFLNNKGKDDVSIIWKAINRRNFLSFHLMRIKCASMTCSFSLFSCHSNDFENRIPLKLVLVGGLYAALQTTLLHMKRLYKTETPTFFLLRALCFQRQPFRFLLSRSVISSISVANFVFPFNEEKQNPKPCATFALEVNEGGILFHNIGFTFSCIG